MIAQTVKIIKLSTDDGTFKLKIGAVIGAETWVIPSTVIRKKMDPFKGKFIVALAENLKYYIPVELLEFTNEFSEVQ